MTEVDESSSEERSRCKWCRRVLPSQKMGRPREFCSQACRQWHWVGKQRAAELQPVSYTHLTLPTSDLV